MRHSRAHIKEERLDSYDPPSQYGKDDSPPQNMGPSYEISPSPPVPELPPSPPDYIKNIPALEDSLVQAKKEKLHTNEKLLARNPIKKRKKGSRWGDPGIDNNVAGLIDLPTTITGVLTSEQIEAYTTHLRIEEITQKIKINDLVPPDRMR